MSVVVVFLSNPSSRSKRASQLMPWKARFLMQIHFCQRSMNTKETHTQRSDTKSEAKNTTKSSEKPKHDEPTCSQIRCAQLHLCRNICMSVPKIIACSFFLGLTSLTYPVIVPELKWSQSYFQNYPIRSWQGYIVKLFPDFV